MSERIGQQFGKYKLLRLLGQGGFAEVYLGERVDIGMSAAIKIVLSQVHDEEEKAFKAEAHTLAQLVHPHIIRLLDYDVANGTPYLVMDYAPYGSLRNLHPQNTAIPLKTVVSYVQQVADGLSYAHSRGIVHRDIKPENMLVGQNHEVLLSDFGIARSTDHSSTANIYGTIRYIAPEQLNGKVYAQSDQYALALTVYEWLSGTPFFNSRMQMQEIVAAILTVPPTPLRQKAPFLPSAVEQVVMRALEKDPQRRFATIKDFADSLQRAAESDKAAVSQPAASSASSASSGVTNVPSLPVVDAKQLVWPTFALSTTQKQEIAGGKMALVPLRTTSALANTPAQPLPMAQTRIPPRVESLEKLVQTGMIIRSTTGAVPQGVSVHLPSRNGASSPASQPGQIARTTNAQAAKPPVTPVGSTPAQRTTGNQLATLPARPLSAYAWIAFIVGVLFEIVTGMQVGNPAYVVASAFALLMICTFIAVLVTVIFCLRHYASRDHTSIDVLICITLSLIVAVIEIVLVNHFYSNPHSYDVYSWLLVQCGSFL